MAAPPVSRPVPGPALTLPLTDRRARAPRRPRLLGHPPPGPAARGAAGSPRAPTSSTTRPSGWLSAPTSKYTTGFGGPAPAAQQRRAPAAHRQASPDGGSRSPAGRSRRRAALSASMTRAGGRAGVRTHTGIRRDTRPLPPRPFMGSAAAPQRPLGAAPPGKMAAGALWGEAGWGGGARRLPAGGRRRSPPRAGPLQLRQPSLLLSRARAALSQPTIRFATVGKGPLVWGFTFDCGGLLLVLVWVLFWGGFCGFFFFTFPHSLFFGGSFFSRFLTAPHPRDQRRGEVSKIS